MAQPASAGDGRLSTTQILSFACASLPLQALIITIAVYLPRYFASHLGISLLAVGAAFSLVRAIDIPIEPVLGMAMDRTRTRWGRYRLWAMSATPLIVCAVYMLFMALQGASRGFLIVWLLVMYLGMSILTLSQTAWAASLATTYHERSRVFGLMTAVGVTGAFSVLLLPIVSRQMGFTDAQGVQAMGWFIMGATPIAIAIVVLRTPERPPREDHGHHFRLRDYWELIARPTMGRVLLADLCLSLGPGWMSAIYLFFFTDSRGFTTSQASILLAIYIAAGFVGAPLLGRLANRISKHRAVMVATTGYSLMLVTLIIIPRGNLPLAALGMFIAGAFAAGFTVLTRAMTADISDEVRLEQGKERSALLFALTTLTAKIAGALSIGLTFSVLEAVGYNAKEGAVNSPAAIRSLELVYLIGPIAFVMIGGLCFIGYKLDAERHRQIRAELDERDRLRAEEQTAIAQAETTGVMAATQPAQ